MRLEYDMMINMLIYIDISRWAMLAVVTDVFMELVTFAVWYWTMWY